MRTFGAGVNAGPKWGEFNALPFRWQEGSAADASNCGAAKANLRRQQKIIYLSY